MNLEQLDKLENNNKVIGFYEAISMLQAQQMLGIEIALEDACHFLIKNAPK